MDLPSSAARRLQANSSGVIAFDFSIYFVANSVFGCRGTKKLIRAYFHVLMERNSKQKQILLRNKVINNRGSLKPIVIERVSVQWSILTFHMNKGVSF